LYVINYTKSDPSGNPADFILRTVDVMPTDVLPPVITPNPIDTPESELTLTDEYVEDCTVTDDDPEYIGICFVELNIPKFPDAMAIDTSRLGLQNVTYNATADSFNAAIPLTVETTIVDTTDPSLAVNGLTSVTVIAGQLYTELNATISDNDKSINGDDTILTDRTILQDGLPYVGPFPLNTTAPFVYLIQYDKDDPSGNSAAPEFRMVVVIADTVDITLATYHTKSKWLTVEGSASDPNSILLVFRGDLFGADQIGTIPDDGNNDYRFRLKGTDMQGLNVTVGSSLPVSATAAVQDP